MAHVAISTKADSQIAHKMPDLGYPLSMANGMMSYNKRQRLLLEWFTTFLRCIQYMRAASDRIFEPIMGHTVAFP